MDPADVSDDKESEPEMEPVESENPSTTNPNCLLRVSKLQGLKLCSEKKIIFRVIRRERCQKG